jgi:uncharacterized membrane protein YGL010W
MTEKSNDTEMVEINIPVIGLVRGLWVMIISAVAFVGTTFVFTYAMLDPTFGLLAKALLGSLVGATLFGTIFGVSRYFTEEQIKYIVINMKLK